MFTISKKNIKRIVVLVCDPIITNGKIKLAREFIYTYNKVEYKFRRIEDGNINYVCINGKWYKDGKYKHKTITSKLIFSQLRKYAKEN